MRRKYNKDEDLKNLKWILLKNEEDLSSKERILLKQILGKSEYKPLKDTYELKNKFRSILEMDISKEEAEKERCDVAFSGSVNSNHCCFLFF